MARPKRFELLTPRFVAVLCRSFSTWLVWLATSVQRTRCRKMRFLNEVRRRIENITTTQPQSLGLYPLVYFYTRGGAFQPLAFLAILQVVKRLIERQKLHDFIKFRRAFEELL